jgi:hypothetical protein
MLMLLKESHLRLRIKTENLGCNHDSAVSLLYDLRQVTFLGLGFAVWLHGLNVVYYVKFLACLMFSTNGRCYYELG